MKYIFITAFILLAVYVFPKPTKMIYIEQVYGLYESNLGSTHTDHKRNIFWLENSLKLPNIHPSEAKVITKTWEEYVKYKMLVRFHIHFLLTKEYTDWGWEYDKQDIVFYNMEWAEKIKKSFDIAKSRYNIAKKYWEETKKWSQITYKQSINIGWEQLENLNYSIENNEFDYDYGMIIDQRLQGLEKKLKKIDEYIAKNKKK